MVKPQVFQPQTMSKPQYKKYFLNTECNILPPEKKKIIRITRNLNYTSYQMYLKDIYGAFHPTAAEYTFFSSPYRTFSRIDNMIGHKTSLSTFKKTEIIPSIFSEHNGTKLEIITGRKLEIYKCGN